MNDQPSKIYLLPNLMTAGNLFCGFTATLKILEGALLQASNPDAASDLFHTAIWCVLAAFVFDFLDGRIARLGGHESPFGREFDSLANVLWPLAHLKSAGRYLQKDPEDIKATGGTNWQKYLPPRFQKTIFFPELWTEQEKKDWGKAAFVKG